MLSFVEKCVLLICLLSSQLSNLHLWGRPPLQWLLQKYDMVGATEYLFTAFPFFLALWLEFFFLLSPSLFSFCAFTSVQFSCSVVSDSSRPHELQHARPPCPSPTPGIHSNSCPSSWWCHPAISSSVVPFSSCPWPFQASGSFPMSQLFASGGQSIGASASTSVLPMNTQDLSPLGWTGWISLQSMGLSRVFSNTTVQKHQFFGAQLQSSPYFHALSCTLTNHT